MKRSGAESESSIQVFTPHTCISSDDKHKGGCNRRKTVVESIAALKKGASENLGKIISCGGQVYECKSKSNEDGYQSDDEEIDLKKDGALSDNSSMESSSSMSDDGSLIYHLTQDRAGHKVSQGSQNVQMLYENAPPPNPLLPRKALPQEPTKSGFVQPFVSDNKLPELGENIDAQPQALPVSRAIQLLYAAQLQQEGTAEDQQARFTEQSLKHFFYLEYRKPQQGEKNPIVYSRFGKQTYDSDQKFNTENFNLLIRTCNLKKLMKGLPGDDPPLQQIEGRPAQYYFPSDPKDQTIVFESRFESGNLLLAHKQSDKEYNLILQTDINSKGHTQWFYFRTMNIKKGGKIKFNLLNFVKSKSLFNEGMKVLIYSKKQYEQNGTKWFRGGEDLVYYQNNYRRESMTQSQRYYYTFTFTYSFPYDDDVVYFAYSQPYTYSNLVEYLTNLEKLNFDFLRRNTLCKTLAGNKCEYLTITSKTNDDNEIRLKKGVIIAGRVHPGESNSSWMMKGVIDYLVSDEASDLRKKFIFKIIPMINPDGVINGNYRCSLAGCDLNRRYKNPSQILHPTVWHLKKLAKEFASQRQLVLYCDLHGHSRRKNVFMYGNSDPANEESTKLFPFIMSKVCDPHFNYDYCRFKVQKSKESSARIALWKELRVPNVFTMEASFCGPKTTEDNQQYHFLTGDLEKIGAGLLKSLEMYDSQKGMIDEFRKHHQKIENQEQVEEMKQLIEEFDCKLKEEKAQTIQEEANESSSGSDSGGSEDNLEAEELAKLMPKKAQKKKMRKKKQAVVKESSDVSKPPVRKIITEELTKEEKRELPVQTEVKKKSSSQRNQYDFKKPTESYLSRFNMLNKMIAKKKLSKDAFTQTTPGKDNEAPLQLVKLERQKTFSPLYHKYNDSISASNLDQDNVTVLFSKKCQDNSGDKYSSTKKPQLSARIHGSGLKPKEISSEKQVASFMPFKAALGDATNSREATKPTLISMDLVKTKDEPLRSKQQLTKFKTESLNDTSIISSRVVEPSSLMALASQQNRSNVILPNRQHLTPLLSAPIPNKRRVTQGGNRKQLDQIDENNAPKIRSVSTANNTSAIQKQKSKIVRVGAVGGGAKALRRGEQSDEGTTAIIRKTTKRQINQSNV